MLSYVVVPCCSSCTHELCSKLFENFYFKVTFSFFYVLTSPCSIVSIFDYSDTQGLARNIGPAVRSIYSVFVWEYFRNITLERIPKTKTVLERFDRRMFVYVICICSILTVNNTFLKLKIKLTSMKN